MNNIKIGLKLFFRTVPRSVRKGWWMVRIDYNWLFGEKSGAP